LTADLSYRCGQHELGNPRLLHAFPGLALIADFCNKIGTEEPCESRC
jgi:hypothetical protein